ncbi:MAG TPA: SRPBCC family protein [SAR202 cluster bacterium]|nr:SRPBCC family protein [SAR202 cluster bacterium]
MRASGSVKIQSSIETIFECLANVQNLESWMNGVSEPRMTSAGAAGLGATFTSVYTYAGKSHRVTYEFVEFEPPTRLLWRSTSGPFPYESAMTLEPDEDGARVTNSVDAGPTGLVSAIWFAVFGPVLRPMMRRQLRRELTTLKALLEDESQPEA